MTPSSATTELARTERRCIWSGETTDDLEEVQVPTVDRIGRPAGARALRVRPEHRAALLSYSAFVARWARWFLVGLALCVGLTAAGAMRNDATGLSIGLLSIGLLLFILPFATPEMVWMLGIRRSIRFARAIGVGLMLAGAIAFAASARG